MKQNSISMRQMMIVLFIALISLAIEIVPSFTQAGSAIYIAPLLAAPVVLIVVWLTAGVDRENFSNTIRNLMGKQMSLLVNVLFLVWTMLLLVSNTARCASRLSPSQHDVLLTSILVLVLSIIMASRRLDAFARSCEIFYMAMITGIVGIVILAAVHLQGEYIILINKAQIKNLPSVTLSLLGISSIGFLSVFLFGDVGERKEDKKNIYLWSSVFFLALAILLMSIVGTFGPGLFGEMQSAFFQMVAGLGVTGAFQRLEALVSALFFLGDVALLGFLLFVIRSIVSSMLQKDSNKTVWIVGVIAFILGQMLAKQSVFLQIVLQTIIPYGSVGITLFIIGIMAMKKAKNKKIKKDEKSS